MAWHNTRQGYGVHLFGALHLPNPLPNWPPLATSAKWVHIESGWALLAAIVGHLGLVPRHQIVLMDDLFAGMLPRRRKIENHQ